MAISRRVSGGVLALVWLASGLALAQARRWPPPALCAAWSSIAPTARQWATCRSGCR